mgnify:CR=1 FL=1
MPTLLQIRNRVGQMAGEGNPSATARLATIDELTRSVIEDIRDRQEWSFDRGTLNVSFGSNGVSTTTLTNFAMGCLLDARKINAGDSNDNVYTLIDPWETDKYSSSDYPIWITGNDVDGWKLNIKDTDSRTLQISYVLTETALTNSTDQTRIPLRPISLGVYAFLLKSDDSETIIDRELKDYENAINILKKKDDRYPKRANPAGLSTGYSIGDI